MRNPGSPRTNDVNDRGFPLSHQAIITRKKRAVYQQNTPQVSADTQQHAMVREGTKATA